MRGASPFRELTNGVGGSRQWAGLVFRAGNRGGSQTTEARRPRSQTGITHARRQGRHLGSRPETTTSCAAASRKTIILRLFFCCNWTVPRAHLAAPVSCAITRSPQDFAPRCKKHKQNICVVTTALSADKWKFSVGAHGEQVRTKVALPLETVPATFARNQLKNKLWLKGGQVIPRGPQQGQLWESSVHSPSARLLKSV